MKYKDILVKGLQIICQLKAFHWQTKDNAQHELFGKLYEDFDQENDQLMQVMMGSINKIIGVGAGQIKIGNINAINPQQYLENCAQFYEEVSTFLNGQSQNNIQPISDILFDIVNLFRKSLYLVRQQSKMKQGTILNQMKRPNEQLLVDLLNQYKSSILNVEELISESSQTFHKTLYDKMIKSLKLSGIDGKRKGGYYGNGSIITINPSTSIGVQSVYDGRYTLYKNKREILHSPNTDEVMEQLLKVK